MLYRYNFISAEKCRNDIDCSNDQICFEEFCSGKISSLLSFVKV